MRRFILACVLFLLTLANAGAGGEVTVAFREDAAPFSVLRDGTYQGYIAGLCEEAVIRAGYTIAERLPISVAAREGHFGGGGVDLVCDPTTVTLARAARVDFSPIVFIANSGVLRRASPHYLSAEEISLSDDCSVLAGRDPGRNLVGVGMVAGTTAQATFALARSQGVISDTLDYALCRFEFESHAEGIGEICDGYVSYYFGDLDILMAQVAGQDQCRASRVPGFGAYEPYAIAIPSVDEGFRRAFVSAIYGLFTDGSATRIYEAAFGTDRLSDPLRLLFSINNIPRGTLPVE